MSRRSRGFTLIELMTVIALVAVLLALLAPAIAQSQDDARRAACMNNLKQIGLAMHNYHDVYNSLPPGWVAKNAEAGTGPSFGWMASVLPFVDQAPLFNTLDFNVFDKNDPQRLQTVIPVYRCPSDPMVDLNPIRGKFASASYSGNAGNERLPGSIDTPLKTNGMFWLNSNCRFQHITDGMSNTFMVGERCLDSASGIWVGTTKNRNENDAVSDGSHHARLNASIESFSSRHPGGANFVMGDGAVRFVSNDIESLDPETSNGQLGTYQKLSQRDDGQPTTVP